jgi:hypothetical protein
MENLGHLLLELRVLSLKIIRDAVRLDVVLCEYFGNGPFGKVRKAEVASVTAVLASMFG